MTDEGGPPSRREPVLRPRTVVPGQEDAPVRVVRPRTIAALGRPDPWPVPPLESFTDPQYQPPSGQVQAVPAGRTAVPDAPLVHRRAARAAGPGPGPAPGAEPAPTPEEPEGGGEPGAAPGGEEGAGRRMVRANLAVATGTLLSRVTGLARTVLLFATLAPVLRDAYVLANNTPNIIYELILGGVLTATLVPLFTEFTETDDDESTSAVVSAAIVALVALTLLAFVATPALMALYASNTPEGVSRGEFLSVGLRLALLFAPQVFFYGAMAVGSALLNSRRRFFAAAWAPVLNNVVVISVLVAAAVIGGRPDIDDVQTSTPLLLLIGLGTTAGIAVMAMVLLPALRRAGVSVRFHVDLRHPAVRRAMALSGWTIGYVIANQVAGQVINVLTEPGSGGTANYQLAFQFFQLPHGLLAVSLMTTFQPELARAHTVRDDRAFSERLLTALRILGVAVVPAAVLYVATPLSTLVAAARRSPDAALVSLGDNLLRLGDAAEVGRILAAFAAGLLGFSLYLFVLRAFYARGDTKTPFLLNCFENVVNVVVAVALVGRYGVVGLAAAYGIAYTVAAVVSTVVLVRRLGGFDTGALVGTYARLAVAGAAAAGAVAAVGLLVGASAGPALVATMVAAALAGLVTYVVAVTVLRVPGADVLARRLPGRRGTRATA